MKNFFHRSIARRLRFYIRPGDRVWEVDPRSDVFAKTFGEDYQAFASQDDPSDAPRPDYLLLNGNIHREGDLISFLRDRIAPMADERTRIIVLYYSSVWRPLWRWASRFGWRQEERKDENWISPADLWNLAELCGLEVVRRDSGILCPVRIPGLDWLANRILSGIPGFSIFHWLNIGVLRRVEDFPGGVGRPSVSVVVPARNEAGNIEQAVLRLPAMGPSDEILFVEGNSTDNTWETIQEVATRLDGHNGRKLRALRQDGKGKGDAVRKGFAEAGNEILMILDADLTTPPEDMPYFYRALIENRGEFVNGNRLVLPMENEAMRFLNLCGNKFFAYAFTVVLGQTLKDTLCGTKVLRKESYDKIARRRSVFGDFDPFGDFDLIFGAARLGLRIVEVPVRYRNRTYGSTNIDRWKHGMILLRMLVFATRRFRFW